MPKLKTHSGAAKRFKKTGSGGYKHRCTNRNHILTKKATGRKRHLRQDAMVAACDAKLVDQMLAGH